MELDRVLLVICLTLLIVGGVNALIYVALRRGNEATQVDLLRRAAERARRPWKEEEDALEELSSRVARLKEGRSPDEE